MNKIRKNLIYNTIYQVFILILPLITAPYVSRVIGADGVGIYSYTYSIVYYFMLIAMLGINNYGNRTIAKARDDKVKMSKNFFGIYGLQLIMSSIMMVLYITYVALFANEYKVFAWIQCISLLSVFFDINWFFFGLEKFKLTVMRNTIVKIISLILLFVLVKTGDDLWKYALLMSGSTLVGQLILLPCLKKELVSVKIKIKDILKHLKPCLVLFVPVVAVSIYVVMDKIMLGAISGVEQVGYYEQASKLVDMPIALVAALGTVMMPVISNLAVQNKNKQKILDFIEKSVKLMMTLSLPICFGLLALADDFVPLFLGSAFSASALVLKVLVWKIIFVSFATITKTQWLIPFEKDKDFTFSVIWGAAINLLLNLILIPKYGALGASIGTIAAEATVMIHQIITTHKDLDFRKYAFICFVILIKSLVMFIGVICVAKLIENNIIRILVCIFVGVALYGILNIKYILSFLKKETHEKTSE